jgi:hypothetical protein
MILRGRIEMVAALVGANRLKRGEIQGSGVISSPLQVQFKVVQHKVYRRVAGSKILITIIVERI